MHRPIINNIYLKWYKEKNVFQVKSYIKIDFKVYLLKKYKKDFNYKQKTPQKWIFVHRSYFLESPFTIFKLKTELISFLKVFSTSTFKILIKASNSPNN